MSDSTKNRQLELSALNGANPLGFLTALGVVTVLHQTGEKGIRLSWNQKVLWTPSLHGFSGNKKTLIEKLENTLKGQPVSEQSKSDYTRAQKAFDKVKKELKDKEKEIKKRKLKGKEYKFVVEKEICPLQKKQVLCRKSLLDTRRQSVPSPELALGQRPDCTEEEYRSFAEQFLKEIKTGERLAINMLSAFGSDAAVSKGRIEVTPFCFITGSGHQWFLDTARELTSKVTLELLRKALLNEAWTYSDEKLSMRWDPLEDRRYALMDRDPNKTRTVWMANLLAYRALTLFPSAPVRGHLETTGWWSLPKKPEQKQQQKFFTWPIWDKPIRVETIRTLLQHPELAQESPTLSELRHLGIAACFRSQRIQVGNPPLHKINFSPATAIGSFL